MKPELKFTLELDAEQLKELINEVVKDKYGIVDATVSLTAEMQYKDYPGAMGQPTPVATGAKIKATLKEITTPFKEYPPGVR